MATNSKRTLQEIAVRYELHPDICDVYVEGDSDKDVLKWFFEASGRRNVVVYPITEIDIPASSIANRQLENSNRGRVMLLAIFLKKEIRTAPNVMCIIDADLDYVLGVVEPVRPLMRTDFTSMDMYGYQASAVHKAALLLGCDLNKTGAEILDEISPLLRRLFIHRLASHVLHLGLPWVGAHKCCEVRGGAVSFDELEFRRRYLNRKGLTAAHRKAFDHKVNEHEMCLTDLRFIIRGRDFTEILAWYFSKHISRPPHPDEKVVRRMLFAAIPLEELARYPLFAALLDHTDSCN